MDNGNCILVNVICWACNHHIFQPLLSLRNNHQWFFCSSGRKLGHFSCEVDIVILKEQLGCVPIGRNGKLGWFVMLRQDELTQTGICLCRSISVKSQTKNLIVKPIVYFVNYKEVDQIWLSKIY